ncbi:hypothetical protein HME9302_01772 [Alteripontixanthobacter maritimus]|uniref:DUF937 domain-containing protein n=1 Tax=Alteripontixanthobacter maritimus TaxID=2161824 RepID=A0A369Q6R9_9SPHN|nr:DUF937 domain-containing protein [Alteripontixanthobacter maritimus]RDC60561.1 hypothetical protein HME9302_01772 [Alteripontixanthobacter maritimus]
MSLAQMLQQSGAINSMAGELGIDERTAQTAAGALLPAIVAGMGRSSAGSTGIGGLGSLIGGMGGGGLLESVLGGGATPADKGNDILGTIFGNKDVSRSVAGEVSSMTGIDEGILKKMLPILAMAVAGYMAKQAGGGAGGTAAGGGLGGILGSIVGGLARR